MSGKVKDETLFVTTHAVEHSMADPVETTESRVEIYCNIL